MSLFCLLNTLFLLFHYSSVSFLFCIYNTVLERFDIYSLSHFNLYSQVVWCQTVWMNRMVWFSEDLILFRRRLVISVSIVFRWGNTSVLKKDFVAALFFFGFLNFWNKSAAAQFYTFSEWLKDIVLFLCA